MERGKLYSLLLLAVFLLCVGCATKKTVSSPAEDERRKELGLQAGGAYDEGDYGKGLELYRQLLDKDPDNAVHLNNMGVLLLKSGQPDAASDAFERASIRAPENPSYLVNAGFALIKLEDYEKAETFFNRALQLDPSHGRAVYGLGVLYLYLNEPEIAYNYFMKAVAFDPMNIQSLFMEAYSAQKNGLWNDAVKGYTAYIGLSHDAVQKANAYCNRALCYMKLGRQADAMKDFDEAVSLNGESAVIFYNRAQGYQAGLKYEEAVLDYTRAISRRVSFPEAYINRGEMSYLLGKKAKGCHDLQRACELGYCEALEKYQSAGKCED